MLVTLGKVVSVPRRAAVGKDQQLLAWKLEIPDKKDFLGFFPTRQRCLWGHRYNWPGPLDLL